MLIQISMQIFSLMDQEFTIEENEHAKSIK